VVGVDFSWSHLKLAEEAAKQLGVHSIQWVEKRDISKEDLGPYDLWYSRIALQHNPPSLIDRFLRHGLRDLSCGGMAVFQVPTYSVNYSFNAKLYIEEMDNNPEIEMHCIPQRNILKLIYDCSCRVLEIREDNSVDIPRYWVSNTFVVEKSPQPS
jgi:hypothetical protein